jgi:CelD/BcsL family acetyltransferase involved in cellulose biosynthesis
VAILPIYRSATLPLRTLRFLGHGPADELGPVCAPGDRPLAAAALRRTLDAFEDGWDLFVGERLACDEAWQRLAGATVLKREASPVLGIHGASWEDFLAGRSANLREQVRRRERRLARAHDLRFRLADDPRRLDQDLDVLFALHQARFGERSRAFATTHRAFHRDFAARALELGRLRLWFAEVDGRPVAAWYGFRFAGAESFYQSGRDPAWERWSLGFVLLVHTIREAFRDGMREYRFLRGDEPYKSRFADRDTGLETLALAPGAAGQTAISAATALAHWPLGRRLMVRTAGRV